jgi:membrane dipeptidase
MKSGLSRKFFLILIIFVITFSFAQWNGLQPSPSTTGKSGENERTGSGMRQNKILFWIALALPAILSCGSTAPESVEMKAARIHDKIFTLDSHVDTPMRVYRTPSDLSVRHAHSEENAGELDFPRMKEGGLDAAFFAVYVAQDTCSDGGRLRARKTAEDMIDLVLDWKAKYPSLVEHAGSPDDAGRAARSGKRIVFLGIENGYPLGTDLSLIRHFRDRGVRYITLCHVRNNDICDSSTDPDGTKWNGLSPFGRGAVAEMNRLGVLIDLSHVSDSTYFQVLRLSRTPVILSHSCCRALMDSPRNLTDSMLTALKQNGGVIQINLCSFYLVKTEPGPQRAAALDSLKKIYGEWSKITDPGKHESYDRARKEINRRFPERKASVKDLADHIDHAVQVAGIGHVGIGSDFDGGAGLSDCEDVSQMGAITLELVRRGYSEKDIAGIWGGNFLRAWREVLKKAGE